MSEHAIRVEHLSKCFRIYERPSDLLKQSIITRVARLRGVPARRLYREFWALRDVSFAVRPGETVGIIGRNGSGKSTLLQMIAGTLTPTVGSIETRGRIAALLELGSGFNSEFTGRENVFMNAAVLGLQPGEIAARFDAIVAFADIGDFIDQPLKTYSSGMVVRLAFAVAINVDPQVLIVDEALSVGDELFQRKCFARIEQIKRNGATILFVSHSGQTIVELCDHAVLLEAGEKLAQGEPKRIVGLYQRLIYAPPERQAEIRAAIRAGDLEGAGARVERVLAGPDEPGEAEEKDTERDFLDEGLKPQSTLEYTSHGARIHSPAILNAAGKAVNYLRRGRRYRWRYVVDFDRPATDVRFGMLVRTNTGFALGGASTAANASRAIPSVAAGTRMRVEFEFACNLNSGTYFLNAGVMGNAGDEEIYLHRILDLAAFRVMPVEGNTSTEVVDFQCSASLQPA